MHYDIDQHRVLRGDEFTEEFQLTVFHDGPTHDDLGATIVWSREKAELLDLVKLLGLRVKDSDAKVITKTVRAVDLPHHIPWEADDDHIDPNEFYPNLGQGGRIEVHEVGG